jgi:uncharacterized membrane protein
LTETIYSKSPTNSIAPADRYAKIFLLLAIILFIAARLWHLTSSCFWFDEIFSVHATEHPWAGVLQFVAADLVHPPLFYLLLKTWIAIGGESLLWLRLFPALVSIAAIWPMLLLARELNLSSTETAVALLLLAVNGYLIKYAQEVRMYSLLFFLSTCSLWLFFSLLRSKGSTRTRVIALTAVNLLLIHTHYYGWLMVILQLGLGLWFVSRSRKHVLVSFAVLVVSYLPWLVALKHAYQRDHLAQNVGWIPRPGLRVLIEYAMLLNQPFVFPESSVDNGINPFGVILVLVLFVVPIVIFLWQSLNGRRKIKSNPELVLAIFAFAPVVLVLIASWLLPKSIWGTRHLIIAAVPYCALAAIAVVRLQKDWMRIATFLILACWFSATGVYALLKPTPRFIWCAWSPLVQQASQIDNRSQPPAIYAFEDLIAYHLWFALHEAPEPKSKVTVIKGVPGVTEDAAFFLPREFNDVAVRDPSVTTEDEIWIAFRGSRLDEKQPPLNHFTQAGYHVDRILSEHMRHQDAFLIKLRKRSNRFCP